MEDDIGVGNDDETRFVTGLSEIDRNGFRRVLTFKQSETNETSKELKWK